MQIAVSEFARHVAGMDGANSTEFDPETPYPVIDLLPEQKEVRDMGGTMRLGADPVKLHDGTRAREIYGEPVIYERHRHRYEVNNHLRKRLEQAGLVFSGTSPDDRLVEIVELPDHPFFVASQFHPEFKSRPLRPQPLFREFVGASLERAREGEPRGEGRFAREGDEAERSRVAHGPHRLTEGTPPHSEPEAPRPAASARPRAPRAEERERLLDDFVRLCEIESPSCRERRRGRPGSPPSCAALGLEVDEDDSAGETGSDAGNLLARIPGPPGRAHDPALRPPRHGPAGRAGRGGRARGGLRQRATRRSSAPTTRPRWRRSSAWRAASRPSRPPVGRRAALHHLPRSGPDRRQGLRPRPPPGRASASSSTTRRRSAS